MTSALACTFKPIGFKYVYEMLIKKDLEDLELNKVNNTATLSLKESTLKNVLSFAHFMYLT